MVLSLYESVSAAMVGQILRYLCCVEKSEK